LIFFNWRTFFLFFFTPGPRDSRADG